MSLRPTEVEANAHLIAAAPELLEALKYMTDVAVGSVYGSEQCVGNTFKVRLAQARAVIAKATGEDEK